MRNFHHEAWFLYTVTSLEWFEKAAQACEDFADVFNRLLTGHGIHGGARLDYWVQAYVDHAKDIRRHIELIREGGDWAPMGRVLNQPGADYKGLAEQPWGWMTEADENAWNKAFDKLSSYCGFATKALIMSEGHGAFWLENRRSNDPMDQKLLNRDDGYIGGEGIDVIGMIEEDDLWEIPATYPTYTLDLNTTCRVGETCPWTGVWIPEEGLENFSLAFAIDGRPMQPAYEIVGETKDAMGFPGRPKTQAVETTWYAVVPADTASAPQRQVRHNVPAGQPCPETGYWFTPALPDSRRHFDQGDIFPGDQITEYGYVFWQWASN